MSEFGTLVLLIGDFAVPQRRGSIAAVFKELLNTDKISQVICTGNVGSTEMIETLKNIGAENCHIVQGDIDQQFKFPESITVNIQDFKLGVIHGHQVVPWNDTYALVRQAGALGVDILVSGHSNKHSVLEVGGKWLINPGSATGALNACGESSVASFMLLNVMGNTATLYTYEERNGETTVLMNDLKKSS